MKTSHAIGVVSAAAVVVAGIVLAQSQSKGPVTTYTATSSNVAGAGESIRIDILRWSTDTERDQLIAAWTNPGAPGAGGRGKRGPAALDDSDPALADVNPAAAPGGRGGGKGKGKGGGPPAEAVKPTPERSLAAALGNLPTVGYLWSSEVAGYGLHYAVKLAGADGGERIILITDRRLGASNDLWKAAGAATPTNYDFSLIELHSNAKGEGEGKVSLMGKVAVDSAAKTFALENYGALPVVLKNVKRRAN